MIAIIPFLFLCKLKLTCFHLFQNLKHSNIESIKILVTILLITNNYYPVIFCKISKHCTITIAVIVHWICCASKSWDSQFSDQWLLDECSDYGTICFLQIASDRPVLILNYAKKFWRNLAKKSEITWTIILSIYDITFSSVIVLRRR